MNTPPSYDWVKKTSQKVEAFFLRNKTEKNWALGLALTILSAGLFLFSSFKISENFSTNGFVLVFQRHLKFATLYLMLHGLVLLLLFNRSSDRFRYLTFLTVVLLSMEFPLFLMEIPAAFPYSGKEGAIGILNIVQIMLPIQLLIIFGLEASKTSPKAPWFKWLQKINERMQFEFDQGVVEQDILERIGKADSKKSTTKLFLLTQGVIAAIVLFLLFFQYKGPEIFIVAGLAELSVVIILIYVFCKLKR